MKINPLTAIDFYKADHISQYPEGTTEVYSNFTPRSGKLANPLMQDNPGIIFFGLQYFMKSFLVETWNEGFFQQPKEKVLAQYKHRMDTSLGEGAVDLQHIADLHDLGYLPIQIKALPEGAFVPCGVPCLTIKNTLPKFFWLTNYLETVMSAYLWKPCTSATTAYHYKKLLTEWAMKTGGSLEVLPFQAHDFSFRGMSGVEDAALSGAGHLTSFLGTDSIPSIDLLEQYYGADASKEPVGLSVPATEHSVMCMDGMDGEFETFKRLITEVYPTGIVSIVSDTWDFWQVITEFLPRLKDEILARDGKVVIRPDSGNPADIICGNYYEITGSPKFLGAVECLEETFGTTTNDKGYKQLNEKIGLIYGDSITIDVAQDICERLEVRNYSSTNVVLGVGSFTYQYVTRDTWGFAMKATSGVVNGKRRDIFKDPKTDDGRKKSAKGLLSVYKDMESVKYTLADGVSDELEREGALKTVFNQGNIRKETTLSEIRANIELELSYRGLNKRPKQ